MLGLAEALRGRIDTTFASFAEDGLCGAFLDEVRTAGFAGFRLKNDTPRLISAFREISALIHQQSIKILACHGYKAGTVGWFAARNTGIPVLAVSRGWTAENWKVALYELLDRRMLRRMIKVVCVSRAQADKVVAAGVPSKKVQVIPNSICTDRFRQPDRLYRAKLADFFPDSIRPNIRVVVGAAGRLSSEKGFDVLIDAASSVIEKRDDVGFVLFGDGPFEKLLSDQIQQLGISHRFVLAGFCQELDRIMPHLDLFVQSSHTEGLPNVLLEALAAGVPVVATDVGGTTELLDRGRYGSLVAPGDSAELADAIAQQIAEPEALAQRAVAGRQWVTEHFTFEHQADAYWKLFSGLNGFVYV